MLAAMDGMSTAAYRSLCFEYGADGATTEMIGALSISRAKRRMKPINRALVMRRPEEKYLAAQIIGSDPEAMVEAGRRLEAMGHFDAIEINMGCPARKVTGSGNGSALLKHPDIAGTILEGVCSAVKLPVRLKLRLGWDSEHITAGTIIQMAEKAGCAEIILHGRTREQFYKGVPNIELMRQVCVGTNIPVYANGGVSCAEDAAAFLENTGAFGLCIGRAALKEPWIFRDIAAISEGRKITPTLLPERIRLLQRFAYRLTEQKKECFAICELRKYVGWWLEGFNDLDTLREKINTIIELEAFCNILEDYLDEQLKHDAIVPLSGYGISLDTVHHPKNSAYSI